MAKSYKISSKEKNPNLLQNRFSACMHLRQHVQAFDTEKREDILSSNHIHVQVSLCLLRSHASTHVQALLRGQKRCVKLLSFSLFFSQTK